MQRRRSASPRRAKAARAKMPARARKKPRAAPASVPPHVAAAHERIVAQIRRTRRLYERSKLPVREIARRVGRSERMVYKYAARYGWSRRGHARGPRSRGKRSPLCEEARSRTRRSRSFPRRAGEREARAAGAATPDSPRRTLARNRARRRGDPESGGKRPSRAGRSGSPLARGRTERDKRRHRNVLASPEDRAARIARARMLYEETPVPVREIAILVDSTEGMVLRWARHFGWAPRSFLRYRGPRGALLPSTDVKRAPFRGRRAAEPGAAAAAARRCVRAGLISARLASATVKETRARQRRQRELERKRAAERAEERALADRLRLIDALVGSAKRLLRAHGHAVPTPRALAAGRGVASARPPAEQAEAISEAALAEKRREIAALLARVAGARKKDDGSELAADAITARSRASGSPGHEIRAVPFRPGSPLSGRFRGDTNGRGS
jgi:hypothetical protein